MVKHSVYLSLVVCVSIIFFGQAAFVASIGYSTLGNDSTSWTITKTGGVSILSFFDNEVDTSNPTPDTVLHDLVDLPDMTLTNVITLAPGLLQATLVPAGPLQIRADVAAGSVAANTVVMSADLVDGGYLTVGTTYMAYSNQQDDLNNVTHVAGYSNVIDIFAAGDAAGYDVDLSFTGDAVAGGSVYDLVVAGALDGSVSGTLSGQINAVPEPGMIAMLSLVAVAFLLRRKLGA